MEQSNRDYKKITVLKPDFTLEFKEETQGFHYNLSIKEFLSFNEGMHDQGKNMTADDVIISYQKWIRYLITMLEHEIESIKNTSAHSITL